MGIVQSEFSLSIYREAEGGESMERAISHS